MPLSQENPKNLDRGFVKCNGEYHGAIISRSGKAYSRVAIYALLMAVRIGRPYIVRYRTKTYYHFDIKRGERAAKER